MTTYTLNGKPTKLPQGTKTVFVDGRNHDLYVHTNKDPCKVTPEDKTTKHLGTNQGKKVQVKVPKGDQFTVTCKTHCNKNNGKGFKTFTLSP